MPVYIRLERIKAAVERLCDWRGQVRQQSTAHVFPLLALIENGVTSGAFKKFEEADDFSFFDRYCREAGDLARPYFDPFSREFRIATHPHSNIATARKGTFQSSWKAAELQVVDGESRWKLNENYARIFADKLFLKSGVKARINVIDISVWLFRRDAFPDSAGSREILEKFRSTFPFSEKDFDELFEYQMEPEEALFGSEPLSASELESTIRSLAFEDAAKLASKTLKPGLTPPSTPSLEEDDPILVEVKALLTLGTSGIILRGAPGTGKSWYADQIALALTNGARDNIFRVQFHPSFSYEDFFEGYVPDEKTVSGFRIANRTFKQAIEAANGVSGYVVVIIDEINRGNTSRIFGEALTYIESGWRDVKFTPRLSTEQISVPQNLLILATMNPHDRSITQLDMAMLRRFDHVDIPPSSEKVAEFLSSAGMHSEHISAVADWFSSLQKLLPFGIGHTFFLNVSDVGRLGLIWRYRIAPFCEQILEFEPQRLEDVRNSYEALERRIRTVAG